MVYDSPWTQSIHLWWALKSIDANYPAWGWNNGCRFRAQGIGPRAWGLELEGDTMRPSGIQ